MKIQNPFAARQFSVGQALLTLWLVVATVFAVIYLKGLLYDALYQKGFQKAVDTLIDTASDTEKCEPITISRQGRRVDVINVQCLQAAQEVAPEEAAEEEVVEE